MTGFKEEMKSKEVVIRLTNVTKVYQLRHSKPTISDLLFYFKLNGKKFKALENFNLEIKKGEKVGIAGRNGAGKTTLLKLIGGISTPNSGDVVVKGNVVSLIDLSAGFHQDLTGIENIFLNGAVIGMRREKIKKNLRQIIEFADIGEFIFQPMYTYSEGMKLRLGFSIAIHSDPDIFLMDEGFAVGDENFREKCNLQIQRLSNEGKTVVIVSHLLGYLKEITDRIIYL